MSRRTVVASLIGTLLCARLPASLAQQRGKVARVGFLGSGRPPAFWQALEAGLRDLGYVEHRNMVIERRWGDQRRMPELAAELVKAQVDVIAAGGTPAILAAKQASQTVPIVMTNSGDAVGSGLVASLARPGGNVTGMTILSGELAAKRVELLKEALPQVRRVAILMNPDNPVQRVSWDAAQASKDALKITLHRFDVRGLQDLQEAFNAMARQRIDAFAVTQETVFVANAKTLADLAIKNRIPGIAFAEFADAGGLIGYGVDFLQIYRRVAYFIDRILKGAKPAELPVERPTSLQLVINLKTAKAIGVQIPSGVLVRANRAVE